jgi:hypothetical protein
MVYDYKFYEYGSQWMFFGEILQPGNKESISIKDFFGQQWLNIATLRGFFLKWPYLNNRFVACRQSIVAVIHKLFYQTCSQIWLSPLVDDLATHLPHKFGNKKSLMGFMRISWFLSIFLI